MYLKDHQLLQIMRSDGDVSINLQSKKRTQGEMTHNVKNQK